MRMRRAYWHATDLGWARIPDRKGPAATRPSRVGVPALKGPDGEQRNERGQQSVGEMRAMISSEIVQLQAEYYGKVRPAKTYIVDDLVVCVLEESFTRAEKTLVDRGEREAIQQIRRRFQQQMAEEFIGVVEQATGRKVRTFLPRPTLNTTSRSKPFCWPKDGPTWPPSRRTHATSRLGLSAEAPRPSPPREHGLAPFVGTGHTREAPRPREPAVACGHSRPDEFRCMVLKSARIRFQVYAYAAWRPARKSGETAASGI